MRHTLPIALLLLTACPSGVTVPVEGEDMAELDQGESTERDMRVEEDAPLDMRVEADAAPACECEPLEVCVEGVCEASENWVSVTIDGEVVFTSTTYEAFRGEELTSIYLPANRNVQITIPNEPLGPFTLSCSNEPSAHRISVLFTGLGDRGTISAGSRQCDDPDSGQTHLELIVTEYNVTRAVGSFAAQVAQAGSETSRVTVKGAFNVAL